MAAESETCAVCMECVPDENKSVRVCGHMMCVTCDASWRSRGKIEEIKITKNKTNCSVYITVSGCPMCRRKDVPSDYMSRSKDSLFHEIQFLTKTLYNYGIKTPSSTDVETVTTPHALVTLYIPLPAPTHMASGICCRKVQGLGCYTTKTKLRCGSCNRFLCRMCRGTCVCQNL